MGGRRARASAERVNRFLGGDLQGEPRNLLSGDGDRARKHNRKGGVAGRAIRWSSTKREGRSTARPRDETLECPPVGLGGRTFDWWLPIALAPLDSLKTRFERCGDLVMSTNGKRPSSCRAVHLRMAPPVASGGISQTVSSASAMEGSHPRRSGRLLSSMHRSTRCGSRLGRLLPTTSRQAPDS